VFSKCRNMSRNHVSSPFGRVLLIGAFLVLIPCISCLGEELVVAGQDSWLPSGLFCFRSGTRTNTQIHLVQYHNGRMESLFSKDMGHTVSAPICLSNWVVATSPDGVIRKLNLKGEFVFAAKAKEFEGASALSGKATDNCIYMTATVYAKPGWLYYLYLVDISGSEPVVEAKFDIIQPLGITRTFEEIVVVGLKDTLRLRIPQHAAKRSTSLTSPAGGFGYGYDAAWNLNYRTNNALVQTFNVNSLNKLTTVARTRTLTVAGTTTSPATNVTVNCGYNNRLRASLGVLADWN
jgi:hypothetical protein